MIFQHIQETKMSAIKDLQNKPENLKYLKAVNELYTKAKRAFWIQILVTVILTVIFSFMKLIPKENLLFDLNACIGIFSILISLSDLLYFNIYVSGLRTSGAKAQEVFDCNVFGLDWNTINSGSKPDIATINESVSDYVANPKTPLENWYDINLDGLSEERAILLCQETNLFYDGKLRNHFKMATLLLCIFIISLSLFIGIIADIKISDYITTVLLPILPMVLLTIKIIMENRKSLTASADLNKLVLQLKARAEEPTIAELRGVQDKIFCNRKDSPLVPNWYYKWKRTKLEKSMKANASN